MRSCVRSLSIPLLLASLPAPAVSSTASEGLLFEERVRGTEAVLRVYHAHQIDSKESFERDVPRAAIEAKVRRTIAQTRALEERWHAPITSEMLRKEWDHVVSSTRAPDR